MLWLFIWAAFISYFKIKAAFVTFGFGNNVESDL